MWDHPLHDNIQLFMVYDIIFWVEKIIFYNLITNLYSSSLLCILPTPEALVFFIPVAVFLPDAGLCLPCKVNIPIFLVFIIRILTDNFFQPEYN